MHRLHVMKPNHNGILEEMIKTFFDKASYSKHKSQRTTNG